MIIIIIVKIVKNDVNLCRVKFIILFQINIEFEAIFENL